MCVAFAEDPSSIPSTHIGWLQLSETSALGGYDPPLLVSKGNALIYLLCAYTHVYTHTHTHKIKINVKK